MSERTPRFAHHQACGKLTGLTLDLLPRRSGFARSRRYARGATVWLPGDPADRICFLEEGRVTVQRSGADGRGVLIRTIEAGEPFGELCFCPKGSGGQDTAALCALESIVLEISFPEFVRYLQADPDALLALVTTFCVRLSDAEQRIEVLAHRRAEERVGRLLLHLARTKGRPSGESPAGSIALTATHDELAQMAAMSRSHVTVTMGRLRDRGLVRYEREQPIVVDVTGLDAYLQDDRAEPAGG